MSRTNVYKEKFIGTIMEKSQADNWTDASQEWDIVDCAESTDKNHKCICGKEHIIHMFKIKNRETKEILFPVGSSCIKKFNRNDMNENMNVRMQMLALTKAAKSNMTITIDMLSRKTLEHLYEEKAFVANKYNKFNAANDLEFLLKMFNKRIKTKISEPQKKKITVIMNTEIIPFLKKQNI